VVRKTGDLVKRIAVAAVALALTFVAEAQQSEVIDVQVTNLDVVVTDGKGRRVTGLTANDFEVLVDGAKQEISNLSEVNRKASTMSETSQPAPRRILLIVDNGSIALPARRKVFDATRAALDRLILNAADRIAVATLSHSMALRLDWTADRAAVLRTLGEIEKDAILPSPDLLAFEQSLDTILDQGDYVAASASGFAVTRNSDGSIPTGGDGTGGSSGGGGGRRNMEKVDFNQITAQARAYAQTATNDSKQTLSALSSTFNAFAAVPGGRKIAILVGGGLPINAGDAVFQKIESVRDRLEGSNHPGFQNAKNASPLTQISAFDIGPQVDAVAMSAKGKGVAIYAVNPEFGDRMSMSARSRASSDSNAEFAVMRGTLDGYQRLATLTGGAAYIGRPADQAVTEIVSDLDSYYSLGYRSAGALNPKSQLVVKVRKGLNARAVLSSGSVSRDWEVADQVLANLVNEPANPMEISVELDPAVMNGDQKTIPMKVMIPVRSLELLPDKGEYAASFVVFVTMGDAGGNGSEPMRQEQSFRWPKDVVEDVKGKTIGFSVKLHVNADRDRVSVGVLDRHSGQAGYARAMLN
jgi:VWFA-related protein